MPRHQPGRLQLDIDLGDDAMQGAGRRSEIADVLVRLAARIRFDGVLAVDGRLPDKAAVIDSNGNTIGHAYYRPRSRQPRKGAA